MQAIITKFLPPTNHRGPRVVAQADAGRITVAWNDNYGAERNHSIAAQALANKFGWLHDGRTLLFGGTLPEKGTSWSRVYVLVSVAELTKGEKP